jgi:hypothetical protein
VLTIPGAGASAAAPPPAPQQPKFNPPPSGFAPPPAGFNPPPAGFSPPTPGPLGAPGMNPLGGPPPGSKPNPFGDKPAPYGPAPVNPYAPPNPAANYFQPMKPAFGSRDAVRPWLLGPAIGSVIFAVCGLGFMSMVVLGLSINPDQLMEDAPQDPAEQIGFYGFFVVYFAGGLITRLIQLIGAIALFRVRGYSLAMAAMICALLPCDVYCCIFCLPIGIWGLIVLNKPEVKAAFELP